MHLQKNKQEEFSADIYFFLWTFKEYKKVSMFIHWTELDDEEFWTVRWVCDFNRRKIVCCVFTDNTKYSTYKWVLTHEIIHWIHYLLEYVDCWWDFEHTAEIVAYFTTYRIEKWTEFLSSIKKNARKRNWIKKRWIF